MSWTQIGNTIEGNNYNNAGFSVDINGDGDVIVIGFPFGDEDRSSKKGEVHVYKYINNSWSLKGNIITRPNDSLGNFGYSVSITYDGNKIAVGDADTFVGVYKFNTSNNTWEPNFYLSNVLSGYQLGRSVSLNKNDGTTLAIGEPKRGFGVVYIYKLINNLWVRNNIEDNTIPNPGPLAPIQTNMIGDITNDNFGRCVKLADNGETILFSGNGIVKMFRYSPGPYGDYGTRNWGEIPTSFDCANLHNTSETITTMNGNALYVAVLSSSNINTNTVTIYYDDLGTYIEDTSIVYTNGQPTNDGVNNVITSFSFNTDGTLFAIGKPSDQTYGSVSVYSKMGNAWSQVGGDIVDAGHNTGNYKTNASFGASVALNMDGSYVAIGAPYYNNNITSNGSAYVYGPVTICLHADTLVLTDKGYKIISSLRKNDIIIDSFGMHHILVNNVELPCDGNFVVIKKDAIHVNFPINDTYITPNHPIVVNNAEISAKKLVNDNNIYHTVLPRQKIYTLVTSERLAIVMNGMPVMTWKLDDLLNFMEKYAVNCTFM